MDFELGIAITAATVLCLAGWYCGRRLSQFGQATKLLFAASILLTLTFSWFISGRLFWANVMPSASVIYWANFNPALLGLVAGLARGVPGLDRWHRPVTSLALMLLGIGFLLGPIARPLTSPAIPADRHFTGWRDGVCLQSHPSSCGAASVATLLHQHGLSTDEPTMIKACLTSDYGTEPLGLYRGVAVGGKRLGRRAGVADRNPGRWQRSKQLPNVAVVRFDQPSRQNSLRRVMATAGSYHAVVVLRSTANGDWLVADPAVGQVVWTDRQLRSRFTGEAVYMRR